MQRCSATSTIDARRLARAASFVAVGLPSSLVAFFLGRDLLRAPFSPLSDEARLQSFVRHVVLMHHKRLPELNATLRSLASAAGAARLHVTVAQALDAADAAAAEATAALLTSLQLPFRNLSHLPRLHAPEAASYSTDAAKYGTKRGSCRNLVHGLGAVFEASPSLMAALVLEDDVRLSADVLEFFDLAASVATASHDGAHTARGASTGPRVTLASAFCYPRDTHEDYAPSKFWPGRLLAGRAEHYRHSALRALTFRTLAWMVTREVYEAMRLDFTAGATPMLALADGAPLHASMAGCSYCENLCYDHWLEWRWRDAGVVCPARPRAAADFSGGMTEHRGILHAEGAEGHHARQRAGTGMLNDKSVRSTGFVDDADRRAAARHLRRLGIFALGALLLLLARFLCRTRALAQWQHLSRRRGDKVATGRES